MSIYRPWYNYTSLRVFTDVINVKLRSWVRIPPGAWIFVCCECRVLSGRGICDELITRPEESYRLCCVVVCDLETSRMGAPYVYDISRLKINDLTLILLTWRKWWAPNNASKQHMGFNSGFKGLNTTSWRDGREWRCSSTHSYNRYYLEEVWSALSPEHSANLDVSENNFCP